MDHELHHDPYREVEMYLEQAQAEIGKAFADLMNYQEPITGEECPSSSCVSPVDSGTKSPDTPSHFRLAQFEFPRPPSGDMEQLLTWANTLVREVNTHWSFDDLDSEGEAIQSPEPEMSVTRSLPLHRHHGKPLFSDYDRHCPRVTCSFRLPVNPNRKRQRRKLWSWPHGSGDKPLTNSKTRDAQVQTRDDELLQEAPSNWTFVTPDDVTDQREKTFSSYSSTSCSSEDEAVAPSSTRISNRVSSQEFRTFVNGDPDRTSWSTVSSNSGNDDVMDVSHCFGTGPVSSTVSWLAVEDDSDHLESKELPKLAELHSDMGLMLLNQKSPSSTLSSVSRDELDTFLRKVASSVYTPPPSDVADSPLQDAITQTTPDLSRSSSFTWVTDCDCSDLSTRLARRTPTHSQDSLPSFSDTSDPRETSSSSLSDEMASSSGSPPEQPQRVRKTNLVWDKRDSSLSLSDASLSQLHHRHHSNDDDDRAYLSLQEGGSRVTSSSLEFKSSSAPLVTGDGKPFDVDSMEANIIRALLSAQRSHSARQLTELEAIDACTWLRAAGFPQYAQMYEDNLFPIDIAGVRKDHEFLDPDAIQSLFRRLNTLNKCARLKSDGFPRKSVDESDEEDNCALSENWQFQRSSRRWSRILPLSSPYGGPPSPKAGSSSTRKFLAPDDILTDQLRPQRDNSRDSVFLEEPCLHSSPESLRKAELAFSMGLPMDEDVAHFIDGNGSPYQEHSLRRSRSERVKDGARAFLRGVESLKVKRKKNREVVIIGGPAGDDNAELVGTVDGSDHHSNIRRASEVTVRQLRHQWTEDDSSGPPRSDSESPQLSTSVSERMGKRRNGSISSLEDNNPNTNVAPPCGKDVRMRQSVKRTQWLSSDHQATNKNAASPDRRSLYDNVPTPNKNSESSPQHKDLSLLPSFTRTNASCKTLELEQTSDPDTPGSQEEMDIVTNERRDSGVGSSLTRQSGSSPVIQPRWHCFTSTNLLLPTPRSVTSPPVEVNTMSVSQLMVLRKFSLLKLTALMEKYSPSNRAGWNWGVPKFIRRIRTPDYKDKTVFGIPLQLVVQRTGQPLPITIQEALSYLRLEGLESQGIFRKSGVRSRIQTLRNQCENHPMGNSFENQQVYDVADMVKQYFRELPDALLTNKLSETFITIFQHIPTELRLEATQAAILLMPDENREALQTFLGFLDEVCQHSGENQMTATNLAVCLAPSLFHLSIPRSASASPRRRKTVGVPDQKDLNENRAAHTCLTTMISNYKRLFLVPQDTMLHCRLSTLEPCDPPNLGDLSVLEEGGKQDNWKTHSDSCSQELLKEAKEKFRGWIPLPPVEGVEVSYKKVGDGHPLKLWKVVVDVEAPPVELLNRILRERHVWDEKLLKWQVVSRLDKQAEIFQYVVQSMSPHPPRDYVVLRSWRIDTAKATCVLVETSVEHSESPVLMQGVRGLVLASQFLVEPCGSGKSRVTYISRIDTRGRSPDWYNKMYGHNSAILMARLRDSFKQPAGGPETKV